MTIAVVTAITIAIPSPITIIPDGTPNLVRDCSQPQGLRPLDE